MKKLSKTETFLLQHTDRTKYDLYQCPKHGLYSILKTIEHKDCPYKCGSATEAYKEKTP